MIGGADSSACLTRVHSRKMPLSCFAIAPRPPDSPEIPRNKQAVVLLVGAPGLEPRTEETAISLQQHSAIRHLRRLPFCSVSLNHWEHTLHIARDRPKFGTSAEHREDLMALQHRPHSA